MIKHSIAVAAVAAWHSRRIKKSEVENCAKNGVNKITEVKIGYDGIVIANSKSARPLALTLRRVFSREQLLDAGWGRGIYIEPRTVDVHIRRLRGALNAGGESDLIRTVRSAGCALDEDGHV